MEIVEVSCPRSINLKNIIKDESEDTKYILQTIDIYDKVIISQDLKKKGIFIKSITELDFELKENIKKLIYIFSKYTNKRIDSLNIDVEKSKIDLLKSDYNILAGLLIGLNIYFGNSLSIHELIYLTKEINELISYYLICGYKKIDISNKAFNIGDNKYKKYFILYDSNEEEIIKAKTIISNYNIDYDYIDNYYFVAIKDNSKLTVPISIKKQFNDMKIIKCENTNKNKVLKKYLN